MPEEKQGYQGLPKLDMPVMQVRGRSVTAPRFTPELPPESTGATTITPDAPTDRAGSPDEPAEVAAVEAQGDEAPDEGAGEAPLVEAGAKRRGRPKKAASASIASTSSTSEGGELGLDTLHLQLQAGSLDTLHVKVRADSMAMLRIAVATKQDPRGRALNVIIQTLLDENGYCAPKFDRKRLTYNPRGGAADRA